MLSKHKAWLKLAEVFEPGKRLPLIHPATRWELASGGRVDGVCIGTIYLRVRGWINLARELEMDRELRQLFRPPRSAHLGYFWREGTHRKERATMCGFMAAIAGRKHE